MSRRRKTLRRVMARVFVRLLPRVLGRFEPLPPRPATIPVRSIDRFLREGLTYPAANP